MLDFLINIKEWKFVTKVIATGFFVGYIPIFSGTLGSIIGVLIVFLFGSKLFLLVLSALFIAIGIVVSDHFGKLTGKADNQAIVIDEIVGIMASFLYIPITPYWLLCGFIIFRIFDMLKVPPANIIDKKIKNGWGVVGDDLVAAIYTNILLHLMVRAYY